MSVREFCSGERFEGGQVFDDVCAVFLEPRGEDEVGTERFDGFVVGHAWGVGGDFIKDSAGFPEVDAVEIVAVNELRGSHSGSDEFFAPCGVIGVVFGAEGDMVDDSCSHPTDLYLGLGEFDSVGQGGGAAEEFDLVFFGFEGVAHGFGEKFFGAIGPY